MKTSGRSRLLALVCLFVGLLPGFAVLHAAPGDLDPLDVTISGGSVLTTVVQPDGKILIGGSFTAVSDVPRNKIARLHEDGSLDTGFNPSANDTVESIVVQADGKILIGGFFTTLQPGAAGPVVTRRRMARLDAGGVLDPDFDPNADREVLSMAVQADRRIVIVGRFGSLQPNGAAAASTRNKIARLHPDGTLDEGFTPSAGSDVYSVALQGDGKILVAGAFTNIGGSSRWGSARLNANGTLDPSFNSAVTNTVNSIAVQADGKILIGGDYFGMARLNANGSRDTAFSPNPNGRVYSMVVQADGKILIAGYFTSVRSAPRNYAARLHPDGTLDTGYDPKASSSLASIAVQADGKILLGGSFTSLQPNGASTPTARAGFARLLNDPATEGLTVPTTNQAGWARGGSSPEFARVTFELSTDNGATWSVLGNGVRVGATPNWQVTGLSLPSSGRIRARGVTCDANGSNGGLLESVQSFNGLAALPKIAVYNGASTAAGSERADNSGTQFLGSAAQTFTIKNTGLADLTGLAVTLSGDAPGDYVSEAPGATTLAPGATTTFTVAFVPTAIGVRNAVVNISSNDADEGPFRIKLSNLLPKVEVRGISYSIENGESEPSVSRGTDFGNVPIHGTGSTLSRTFAIRNTGAANLTLGTVSIGGTHAADFSVTSQPVSPVAPNTNRSFTITFDPADVGLRSAIVSFSSNDADQTPFSFVIQGNGFVSNNADLSSLSLSVTPWPPDLGLTPGFASGTTSYKASVSYGDGSLTVSPTKAEANASIAVRVNGGSYVTVTSGSRSSPLALHAGVNMVDVRVTAQDDISIKTYSVAVTRASASAGDVDPLDAGIGGYAVYATAVQPDGKTILGGSFHSVLGVTRQNIARLNADGTLDSGFNPMADGAVTSVVLQSDGKVLLGGSFTALQPDGEASPITRNRIARLNPDGTLDTGFDPNADLGVTCIVLQPDGKILVGGEFSTLQPNGAANATPRNRLARLYPDGSLDPGFDPHPDNAVACMAVQGDGKILLGGGFTTFKPNGSAAVTPRSYVARLNSDGTLDSGFNPRANNYVASIALQADNKVLLGGDFTTLQPNGATSLTLRNGIARLNADGSLDTGFNPNANGRVSSVVVQADGKILLGGTFSSLRPNGMPLATTRYYIARVNGNGYLDSFNPSANSAVHSVALQANGRVLLGGSFSYLQPNGASARTNRSGFARIFNDPATQSLTVPDAGRIQWLRGGTSPEVSQVVFELTTDGGGSFTPLGSASRIDGTADWQLTGVSLPPAGMVRARGRTWGGTQGASSGLVESVLPFGESGMPIAAWRQIYFGSTANSGNGADTFDFDKDGLVNLIEYAFGLDPTKSDGGQLPLPQRTGGHFTVLFSRPAGVGGITYGAEWSENLRTWTSVADTGVAPQHRFSVPMEEKKALFLRLSVTSP